MQRLNTLYGMPKCREFIRFARLPPRKLAKPHAFDYKAGGCEKTRFRGNKPKLYKPRKTLKTEE